MIPYRGENSISILLRRFFVSASLLLFSTGAPLLAQPLDPAVYDLTCNQHLSTKGDPHAFGCRDQGPMPIGNGTFERRSVSQDHVGAPLAPAYLPQTVKDLLSQQLGGEPHVFLTAVASSVTIDLVSNSAGVERAMGGGAIAGMDFQVRVDEIATPPVPVPNVPVAVRMYGEAELSGRSSVSMALIGGGEVFEFSHGDETGTGTGGGIVSFNVFQELGRLFPVALDVNFSKHTECSVQAARSTPGSATSSCYAAWDPLLELDQEAFDGTMGASTFPLDQYFRIVYSPNMPLDALFRDGFEVGDTSVWSSQSD